MRRILSIFLCTIGISVYAVDYTAMQMTTPAATMQSVNSSAYMSSGSTYSSTVFEVGSSSPAHAPAGSRPRKSGFNDITTGGESTDYDPNNPQFAPLGDALIPLLLFALAYGAWILTRRKKTNY